MANDNTWANISDFQTYLFNNGDNFKSYEMLGAHKLTVDAKKGWRFAVWAPNAKSVHLAGDFNGWSSTDRALTKIGDTGIWYGFYTDINEGELYKYAVEAPDGTVYFRADPYAFEAELRPGTASRTKELAPYKWADKRWMNKRQKTNNLTKPINIYEIHAGSWRLHPDGSFYTYQELADELVPYLKEMGYNYIELMPVTEYPFDGS